MFDTSPLPGVDALAGLGAAELIEAARGWARAENAACAAKLAVMAEIFIRRTGLPAGERELWWLDPTAAVAAELAAAQNISRSMALHQTHRGVVLRDRLPQVGALFAQGLLSEMLVRQIIDRTDLILDAAAMAAVDADLAAQILGWGPQSRKKTEIAIDALIEAHDPGALRRNKETAITPNVEFGLPTDAPGFTTMWARLYKTDAAMIERCLTEMTYSVCEADPRCLGDRLAAAITAHFAGLELACHCGLDDCQAARRDRPTKDLTVYVLTDHTTTGGDGDNAGGGGSGGSGGGDGGGGDGEVAGDEGADGDSDEGGDDGDADAGDSDGGGGDAGDGGGDDADDAAADDAAAEDAVADDSVADDAVADDAVADDAAIEDLVAEDTVAERAAAAAPDEPEADRRAAPSHLAATTTKPGFVFGAGIVPNAVLDGLLAGATIREVRHPGHAGPEPHYRPSRALADFVRCRDLTCRFPGCDHPATTADIDHTVPHPIGPTHASNLKCLCRFHHLLKTFWIGALGWHDRQHPDGTIIWTSPTGHTFTTHPGSRLLFPSLCRPTATLWTGDPPAVTISDTHSQAMPRRRHTRAHNRARAIDAERQLNNDLLAEHTTPPPF